MIIANGTIERKVKSGGGLSPETGNPVKTAYTWAEPVECQIIPVTVNYQGVTSSDGRFVKANYRVLIDRANFFTDEVVRITSNDGLLRGREFSVISITPLDAVDEVSILV